jgi:hypothetical protein
VKLLVFTYAPAGLGHLRVTGALVNSKPKDIPYVLLGSSDRFITNIHRFTSINPIARKIFEASQYGLIESIFTLLYVWLLRKTTRGIYLRMMEIIDQHTDLTEMTVVATHFGLAHQIGEIKDEITKKTNIKINLVVQVTDDTSQHIWCVKGADITMVPSELTKKLLTEYAMASKIDFNCVVSPYPLSSLLTEKVPSKEGLRNHAFGKGESDPINVIVPISGAAVGLKYLSNLLTSIDRLSTRFHFLIIAKRSNATKDFLMMIGKLRWVELVTGRNDNEVVRLYEKTYVDTLVHIEITKPSEQAFKAMISPDKVGGSILLFTNPVGRQEVDNIYFLKRHGLIPITSDESINDMVTEEKGVPRGISLPSSEEQAAKFVLWCLTSGLFYRMADPNFKYSPESLMTGEVNDNGAWLFWEKLKITKLI